MPLRLCIIHVSRAGSHAIQNWLCTQLPGYVHAHIDWCPRRNAGRTVCEYNNGVLKRHFPNREKNPEEQPGAHRIIMLENFDLRGWHEEGWAGCFDMVAVIARDPYNWLASTYREMCRKPDLVEQMREGRRLSVRQNQGFTKWYGASMGACGMWTQQMRHGLGDENLIGQPVHVMDYNQWVIDREYREALALEYGVEKFTDAAFREVPPHGGGSSWTGRKKLKGQGITLMRYPEYVGNEQFRSFVTPEMVRIGKELFGMECPW